MFSPPAIFWVAFLLSSSLGILGLQLQWRKQVIDQATLDRCVHEEMGELLQMNRRIDLENKALGAARLTYLSLKISAPVAAEAIRPVMNQIRFRQNLERWNWERKKAQWWNPWKKCAGRKFFFPIRYPTWGWRETPPDPIGPVPWHFELVPNLSTLELRSKTRRSSACISALNKAHWCKGQTLLEFLVWILMFVGIWVSWTNLERLEKNAYLHSLKLFPQPLARSWF